MKFNFISKEKTTIVNHENAIAFPLTPEYELYAAVVTTSLNASFYEKDTTRLERIQNLIQKCNPVFVAKLAVYARNEMHMRSVPLVLVVELAKIYSGDSLISKTITHVIQRADEITELLAYYQMANDRNGVKKLNRLSKQIQKGLAVSFNKFDEYQLAKYNRDGAVKLKDALFLVHPKAKDEVQQELFNKIVNDTLQTPYTWETELSQLGQVKFYNEEEKQKAFTQKWEELIESNKLGYMALLRNLRNILEANVSGSHIMKVCDFLSNEKAVSNSKQLPFRFLAAYRELKLVNSKYTASVLDALESAVMVSAQNIKGFDVNTSVVIACDVSGSMQKAISPKSKVMLYDIGLMLGMLMQSRCQNVVSGMFGDFWKIINMPKRSVLSNVNEYYRREGEVGYSTNGYLVLEDLIKRNEIVDKVMLFTDVQMWNSNGTSNTFSNSWMKYKRIAPNAKLYLFDLAGYGQVPINVQKNDVYLIAGWSDKVFDVLHALEDKSSALNYINQIEL
ncbi:TROVE domain-containing protein [Flavobacterium sp. MC2016-06]|jgi:60 kDa SS-A/Ro ribonucleoprotein|uniref:TROVE domain-containing protein n=1 Tax=Flavobacterium sp. MC2016-06 TaxID=2676308 RepID=UPI0012BA78A5|nr:TROVE domain-containing protein [Flavobacterium sp. MC2016-06]MBU3858262.1 TROVE domain-containing protein [Flavobacterium sp. MC2016-06]